MFLQFLWNTVGISHLWVVLDDDDVLEVRSRAGVRSVAVQTVLRVARRTARVHSDLEGGLEAAQPRRQVHTVTIAETERKRFNFFLIYEFCQIKWIYAFG